MGPSNEVITPHGYTKDDYMYEFNKIGEVKVLDAYWVQDPNLPEELAWLYEEEGGEGEEYSGILLRLIPDNMEDIDQSVEYTLEMDDGISKYYDIENGIKIAPIK